MPEVVGSIPTSPSRVRAVPERENPGPPFCAARTKRPGASEEAVLAGCRGDWWVG